MFLLRPKPQLATSPLPSLDCGSVDKADGFPATCFDLTISAIEIAGFFQAKMESLDCRRVRISPLSAARRLDTPHSPVV